eukprot:SAG22_NODE_1687_length_3809_cov_11.008356_1_plen_31_part_10
MYTLFLNDGKPEANSGCAAPKGATSRIAQNT